eukprot:1711016-Amphidinium_carterae.1
MRAAQAILLAPELVPLSAQHGFVHWYKRIGIPPQPALMPGLILPHWHAVRELLFQFPIAIARHFSDDMTPGVELWRRWDPGYHESQFLQLVASAGFGRVSDYLTDFPLHVTHAFRLCRSQRVQWKLDIYRARDFGTLLNSCPAAHIVVRGESLLSRIVSHGVASLSDLKALA